MEQGRVEHRPSAYLQRALSTDSRPARLGLLQLLIPKGNGNRGVVWILFVVGLGPRWHCQKPRALGFWTQEHTLQLLLRQLALSQH